MLCLQVHALRVSAPLTGVLALASLHLGPKHCQGRAHPSTFENWKTY